MFDPFALSVLLPVLCVAGLAGLVYGFAGFGGALLYMPLATIWLPPEIAVGSFAIAALISLVTLVPRAWPLVEQRAMAVMLGSAMVTVPLGLWVLRSLPTDPLRVLLAAVVTVTLAAMVLGWRYQTQPGLRSHLGVGAATGLVGGATGITGPVVILFHLSGQGAAAVQRANILTFLTILSLGLLPHLALQGLLSRDAVLLGLAQLVPYGVASRLGQWLFRPERELLFRRVAYALIALSVVLSLWQMWQSGQGM